MPLPLIFPPVELKFHAQGHDRTPEPEFEIVEMMQGESRTRRVADYGDEEAPQVARVATLLHEFPMRTFWEWGNETLDAWREAFVATVASLGGPSLVEFWRAEWVEPPQLRAIAPAFWEITGAVRLIGVPESTRPATGEMSAEVVFSLGGSAKLTVPTNLTGEAIFSLGGFSPLAGEALLSLGVPSPRGNFEREDDDSTFIMREDGSFLLRET